jgi:hypothetical protein
MTLEKKVALRDLLDEFEAYMDEDENIDPMDLDILVLCNRIPAGFEDLLNGN